MIDYEAVAITIGAMFLGYCEYTRGPNGEA